MIISNIFKRVEFYVFFGEKYELSYGVEIFLRWKERCRGRKGGIIYLDVFEINLKRN